VAISSATFHFLVGLILDCCGAPRTVVVSYRSLWAASHLNICHSVYPHLDLREAGQSATGADEKATIPVVSRDSANAIKERSEPAGPITWRLTGGIPPVEAGNAMAGNKAWLTIAVNQESTVR
jgi:hypothetical protein